MQFTNTMNTRPVLNPRTVKYPRPWTDFRMQFSTTTEDYNVAEFYDMFGHMLPKLVMVNQGFCGDIIQDTFDREQMMRLHTVSKQKRVIAKFQSPGNKKIVSIPISYDAKMCVQDRKGKPGQEQMLSAILKHTSLPVFVQFPRDRIISIGNQNISTNWIPKMELVQTFDEMYFLANFINDGILTSEVIPVPLYLKQLRLVEVTGIKGQPLEKWNSYFGQLGLACEKLHYDLKFGNSEVAVYDPSTIYVDTMYSYVEPTIYSPMYSLFRKPVLANPTYTFTKKPECHAEKAEKGNTYEEIGSSREHVYSIPGAQQKLRQTHAVTVAPPMAHKPAIKDPSWSPALPRRNPIHHHPTQPPVQQQPIHAPAYGNVATRLVRQDQPLHVTSTRSKTPKTSIETVSSGFSPQTSIETVSSRFSPKTSIETLSSGFSPQTSPGTASKQIASLNGPDEVAKLSIDELRTYLEALNLGQYADFFKEQLIDGAMLVELDKTIFKEDFGLKIVEAIRLEKFALSGYLPR